MFPGGFVVGENPRLSRGLCRALAIPRNRDESGGGRKKEAEKGKREGGNNEEAEMRSIEAIQHPSLLEDRKE